MGGHTSIDREFDGKISDVRVYNRVLSQNEISMLYNAGKKTNINTLTKRITTTESNVYVSKYAVDNRNRPSVPLPEIARDSLMVHYDFSRTDSDGKVIDESWKSKPIQNYRNKTYLDKNITINNSYGTLDSNASIVSQGYINKNCLSLNVGEGYIDVYNGGNMTLGNSNDYAEDWTISCWLNSSNVSVDQTIWAKMGSNWTINTTKIVSESPYSQDYFAQGVVIYNDTIVVNEYRDGSDVGAVFIFVKSGNNWTQQAKLTASDGASNDEFGFVSDIYEDTIVVSASRQSSYTGSAYIFVRNGSNWSDATETVKITASDGVEYDYFGGGWCSAAIYGDTVVVGAYKHHSNSISDAGAAYIFTKSGGVWPSNETQKLIASDAAANDYFGHSVAIYEDTIVVGAYFDESSNAGSAYIFKKTGNTWSEIQILRASDAATSDKLGQVVAIYKDTIVLGSQYNDHSGYNAGAVYIYEKSGGEWSQFETQKITASDAAASDFFGMSISIHKDIIVVGAPYNDDDGDGSGSAYIFVKSGGVWPSNETQKIRAYDAAGGDYYGYIMGVSVYNNIIIVGSPRDDPSQTNAGSAYIYEATPTWSTNSKRLYIDQSDNNKIKFEVYGGSPNLSSNYSIEKDKWANVIVSKGFYGINDNIMSMYIDGKLCARNQVLTSSLRSLDAVRFGYNGTDRFSGLIDDIRIYNTRLNDYEIEKLYKNETTIGPLTHYTFEEDTGTVVYDMGTEGSHLTVSGAVFKNKNDGDLESEVGVGNTSLYFDGTNDYCQSNSVGVIRDHPRTVALWVKRGDSSIPSSNSHIVSYGVTGGQIRQTYDLILNRSNTMVVSLDDKYTANSSTIIKDTLWHHVAAVTLPNTYYSSGESGLDNNIRIFVDGVDTTNTSVYSTVTCNTTILNTSNTITLGKHSSASSNYFKGYIDDFRVYNMALTPNEIKGLYYNSSNYARIDFD